jgi:hypothetical protein
VVDVLVQAQDLLVLGGRALRGSRLGGQHLLRRPVQRHQPLAGLCGGGCGWLFRASPR